MSVLPTISPGWVGSSETWEHHCLRGAGFNAKTRHHDIVESRRDRVGRTLELEESRNGALWVSGQGFTPPEIVERLVQNRGAVDRHRMTDAPVEERSLLWVHQRSVPRSRSLRAMMLRWISAVPP